MRDWIYTHRQCFNCLLVLWYGGLFTLHFWHATMALLLGILSSLVLAHLVWGSKWLPGEQEWPPYNPDE